MMVPKKVSSSSTGQVVNSNNWYFHYFHM